MHILDIKAIRSFLPFLYFFCPSTLQEVSTPIQELALTPYVVNEAQRGFIYGLTAYNYLPLVPQILRTLLPSDDLLAERVVLHLDPPKSNHYTQHPTPPIPCIVQPTCSRLDAPDLANISRIPLDPHTIPLVRRWPASSPLQSNLIIFAISIFAMLQLGLVLYIRYTPPHIIVVKLFPGGAVYIILVKSPLLAESDPHGLLTAVAAGKDTIAISLEFVSSVRNVHISPLRLLCLIAQTRVQRAESSRSSLGLNLVPAQTFQAIQNSILKTDVGIPTDLALAMPGSQVNINITPAELSMDTAKPFTQFDRITVDMGVQTNPTIPTLTIDREIQTELGPESAPSTRNVESDMQLGNLSQPLGLTCPAGGYITTNATLVCPKVSGQMVVDGPRTEQPMGSAATSDCDGTDILVLDTGGSTAIPVVDRTSDSDCTLDKIALVTDERRTNSAIAITTCAGPSASASTTLTDARSPIAGSLVCAAAPAGLDVVKLEDCTKAGQTDRTPTPTPKSTLRFTPSPRLQAPVAQTLSGSSTRFAQPPPFRPPGLGYQPPAPASVSRTISGGTPLTSNPPPPPALRSAVSDRTPTPTPLRPRFPGPSSSQCHPQQFLLPPPVSPASSPCRLVPNGSPGTHPARDRFPSPVPSYITPTPLPTVPAPRPYILPTRDFSTRDPFSRNLTPVQSAACSRGLPGRFRPLGVALPSSVAAAAPASSPTQTQTHPLLEKAPAFWAPPRENSALAVVPPNTGKSVRLRVRRRTRTRTHAVGGTMDYSQTDGVSTSEDDEEDSEHVGVAIASAVLGSLDDIAGTS